MYFKCEQDNLLYAYEHPTTKLWTVCVYNIPNNLLLSIANAHQKFVTGIALIKDNTLITVSLDGKIKVWTFNTAKSEFEINTAVTQQLQSKMEGNQFTVCKVYEPLNTMVVGSKSGNVIMWNLSTMECAQTLIPTYVIPIIWYLDAYLRYLAQVFEGPGHLDGLYSCLE
jgi:WD40 repeat protein